jgi:hypothetical protein
MNLKQLASILICFVGFVMLAYGVYDYFIVSQTSNHKAYSTDYINIEAILIEQTKWLEKSSAKCLKVSVLNGDTDKVWVEKPNWKKDLALFDAIYLNKSNLKGAFIHKSLFRKGKIVDIYKKVKNAKTNIEFVEVHTSLSGKFFAVKSKVNVHNLIFESTKNYELYFDTTQISSLKLNRFVIQGQQGFLFSTPEKYHVAYLIK